MKTLLLTLVAGFWLLVSGFAQELHKNVTLQGTTVVTGTLNGLTITPGTNSFTLSLGTASLTAPPGVTGTLLTADDVETVSSKTIPLGTNTLTITMPDSGSVAQNVAAVLEANVVTPQQFGAVGDNSHDDTAAIQAALDTGRSVYLPEGTYKITSALTKKSVGQWMLGAGTNRTVLSQVTNNTDAIDLRDPSGDGITAHQWKGAYSGGGGIYLQEIGEMTIQSTNAGTTGKAISIVGTPGVHSGDWVFFHDLFCYQWHYGVYDDSLAHLRVSHCVFQNASSLGAAYGTGIYITGANPNSNIIEGVTLSGLTAGLDLLCGGTKINAGDVGQCTTGIQIQQGSAVIDGGHMENCSRYLSVGSAAPATVSVNGLDVLLSGSESVSPFKVNSGSILTGTVSGSAFSGTAMVECVNETDHALIVNIANASDSGTAAPEQFQFHNDAIGKTYRFPSIDLLKQDSSLPAASAAFLGKLFWIANGSGLGSGRVVGEYEDNSGAYHWSDLLNDTLLSSSPTVTGGWTFSSTLISNSSGELQAANGYVGTPAAAGGGMKFGSNSSGDGYITEWSTSGSSLGGIKPSGVLQLNDPAYLYLTRQGNATAGCLQTNDWTLYSPANNQFGIGFSGTQGLLVTSAKTTISSGVLHLTPLASAPGSPVEGDVYVNSTDHHTYEWNGTAWKQLDN